MIKSSKHWHQQGTGEQLSSNVVGNATDNDSDWSVRLYNGSMLPVARASGCTTGVTLVVAGASGFSTGVTLIVAGASGFTTGVMLIVAGS